MEDGEDYMMGVYRSAVVRAALGGAAAFVFATAAMAGPAMAQSPSLSFNLPAGDLGEALRAYAVAADVQIVFDESLVRGKRVPALRGGFTASEALNRLLSDTGLAARSGAGGVLMIERAAASHVAISDGAEVDLAVQPVAPLQEARNDDIIVTAQKREESMQDVPIAMSAFTARSLNEQKIEGGFDLMKAVPNLTFSKSNFTSYNLSIRGIGTKAVSATTDPGVAVSFNSVAIIQNRLFEQEYFDIERVEVLRGPQGTLYGRNATAGVVNVISAKADLDDFSGSIKGEVGNYDSRRLVAMLNVPLFTDQLAIRFAGSMTQRSGYDFNSATNNDVNGRDLWSTRLTIGFEPSSRLRANFIWERFEEDDNRSRTGKQLCHRDDGAEIVGSTTVVDPTDNDARNTLARPALFSTGCKAGSLYDEGAFGTPNGLALPFITSMIANASSYAWGYIRDPDWTGDPTSWSSYQGVNLLKIRDPYGGLTQSRNLREIASFRDPVYRAKADLFQLNFDADLSDGLTLTSQTAYVEDRVYSFQDYNRFNTQPFFQDTSQFVEHPGYGYGGFVDAAPGGIFCDPQLGCSNTMAGFDISRAEATQFTQELRLASAFDGPVNFSLGGNYTRFKAVTQYYVMNNVLTALAMSLPFNGSGSWSTCGVLFGGMTTPGIPMDDPDGACPYIDPNPVETISGEGHNYFRSVNPYKVRSIAAFGELYWNINPDLKLTAGLRYTDDRKTFTPVPSQLLLAPTIIGGGVTGRGYPALPDMQMQWGEFTGRLGIDWQPNIAFTDDTLLYAFYSRGYKGGGANPPTPGFASGEEMLAAGAITQDMYDILMTMGLLPALTLNGLEYGKTFDPEYVNAFEIGTKNTLLGGAVTLNAHAFFYDYKDYQVSQIRNRTSINENFDATIWGFELQTAFQPSRNFRLDANLGYLRTRIGGEEQSIDIMNRNLGNPDYTVFKSWAQIPANCVIPTPVAEGWLQTQSQIFWYHLVCGGARALTLGQPRPIDPATNLPYDPANYPELNGGSGLMTDLSGNELPNAPRWTANIGAQYTVDFGTDWSATIRGDGYWQAKSWHRVYNYAPYDRLKGWQNFNLSLWVEGPDNLRIEAYVKNLLDSTPITDAFLNSDDSGLTTNIFTLDPRIIGFSIAKSF